MSYSASVHSYTRPKNECSHPSADFATSLQLLIKVMLNQIDITLVTMCSSVQFAVYIWCGLRWHIADFLSPDEQYNHACALFTKDLVCVIQVMPFVSYPVASSPYFSTWYYELSDFSYRRYLSVHFGYFDRCLLSSIIYLFTNADKTSRSLKNRNVTLVSCFSCLYLYLHFTNFARKVI